MRRSKLQILSAILKICIPGVTKTRIVYQCNLNFKTAEPYLVRCLQNGLLIREGKRYVTTARGREMAEKIEEMDDLLV